MSTGDNKYKNIFLIGVLASLILFAWSLNRGISQLRQKNERFYIAQEEVSRLEAQNNKLKTLLAQDPAFEAETEIRDQLGLAKPGETVIMIEETDLSVNNATSESKLSDSYLPWWKRILNWQIK